MFRYAVGRWSRAFTAASLAFLVLWRTAAAASGLASTDLFPPWAASVSPSVPHRSVVTLAVLGFVCHLVFGKAYLLVPSYYQRVHPPSRVPGVHLALTGAGALLLAAGPLAGVPDAAADWGALAWAAGVAAFLGSLARSLRGALAATGLLGDAATASERAAMAVLPVPFAYLAAGAYGTVALHWPVPLAAAATPARVTHLYAAGLAALLVFALGVRLLPRFLDAEPTPLLTVPTLAAGAVGPGLLAASLWEGALFRVAAALETVAVTGFALQTAVVCARSDRRTVGLYGVLAGALVGVAGVVTAAGVAAGWVSPALVAAHASLALGGFLAVTALGFLVQFYPPAGGEGSTGANALTGAMLAAFGGGVALEAVGSVAAGPGGGEVAAGGTLVSLAGAVGIAGLVATRLRRIDAC